MANRQWLLERRPVDAISDRDLLFKTNARPTAKKGEGEVKVERLSQFPIHRIWMSAIDPYLPPVAPGPPMHGGVSGRVIASGSDLLQEGPR